MSLRERLIDMLLDRLGYKVEPWEVEELVDDIVEMMLGE